jgi:hypothetical protein
MWPNGPLTGGNRPVAPGRSGPLLVGRPRPFRARRLQKSLLVTSGEVLTADHRRVDHLLHRPGTGGEPDAPSARSTPVSGGSSTWPGGGSAGRSPASPIRTPGLWGVTADFRPRPDSASHLFSASGRTGRREVVSGHGPRPPHPRPENSFDGAGGARPKWAARAASRHDHSRHDPWGPTHAARHPLVPRDGGGEVPGGAIRPASVTRRILPEEVSTIGRQTRQAMPAPAAGQAGRRPLGRVVSPGRGAGQGAGDDAPARPLPGPPRHGPQALRRPRRPHRPGGRPVTSRAALGASPGMSTQQAPGAPSRK